MTGATGRPRRPDVAVVGAGPAGLGVAIACARRGLAVVVLERRDAQPLDKACGEGLMPDAVLQLRDWGVQPRGHALRGIRYRDESESAEGAFPGPPGLGVRRIELSRALVERATALGVDLRFGDAVSELQRQDDQWMFRSATGSWRPRVLVGADGLRSFVRRSAGLERPHRGRRVGMRRHVRLPAGAQHDGVEVVWGDGVEAYLTPVGERELGVALLEDPRRREASSSDRAGGAAVSAFERAIARVPGLAQQLDGLESTTEVAGSGPLRARAAAPTAGSLALVGDAGGYVDAITGEGMAIAFAEAEALARALDDCTSTAAALRAFARASRRVRRLPDLVTRGALLLAARPSLRRRFLRALAMDPSRFDRLLALHVRAGSDWDVLSVATVLAWGLVRAG